MRTSPDRTTRQAGRQSAARQAQRRRAALVATVLFTLGTAGHAMASGALPSLAAVVPAGSVAWMLGYGFAQHRRHWLAALGLVVGVQVVLHLLLAVVDGAHAHGAHTQGATSGTAMLLAHAVASAGGLLAIVVGDALIAAWTRFVTSVLGAWTVDALPVAPLVVVRARTERVGPTRHRSLAWSLRGPPAVA